MLSNDDKSTLKKLIKIKKKDIISEARKDQLIDQMIKQKDYLFSNGSLPLCPTETCEIGSEAQANKNHRCRICQGKFYEYCECGCLTVSTNRRKHIGTQNHDEKSCEKIRKILEKATQEKPKNLVQQIGETLSSLLRQAENKPSFAAEGVYCCYNCEQVAKNKTQINCEQCGSTLSYLGPEVYRVINSINNNPPTSYFTQTDQITSDLSLPILPPKKHFLDEAKDSSQCKRSASEPPASNILAKYPNYLLPLPIPNSQASSYLPPLEPFSTLTLPPLSPFFLQFPPLQENITTREQNPTTTQDCPDIEKNKQKSQGETPFWTPFISTTKNSSKDSPIAKSSTILIDNY